MAVLYYADIIATSIFVLESVIKIIAYGLFFNGVNSYLRIGWNVIDMLIVISSVVGLVHTGGFKLFKVFRLLRVLRPLRVIARN